MADFEPVSSGFIGVYRSVFLRDLVFKPVICENFTDNSTQEITPILAFDGQALPKTHSFGKVAQGLSLSNSPVIIGDHDEYLDSREFFFHELNNLFPLILNPESGYELPLLTSTNLSINETGANMNFSLKSDGIRCYTLGDNRELYLSSSVDNTASFCADKARVAYNQDFVVAFGPYQFFILDMAYDISIQMREFPLVRQTLRDTAGVGTVNDCDFNRQYTMLVPGKVSIKASGNAQVDLENCSIIEINTNYEVSGYKYLSLQTPGDLNIFKQKLFGYVNGNQFELFIKDGNYYSPFFRKPGSVGIEITSGYLSSLSLNTTQESISVGFECVLNGQLNIF